MVCKTGPTAKPVAALPAFAGGVTAVAFANRPNSTASKSSTLPGSVCLAVGLEDGLLEIWSFDSTTQAVTQLWRAADDIRHCAAVRRLAWRPCKDNPMQLASCSNDHCVKLLDVQLLQSS